MRRHTSNRSSQASKSKCGSSGSPEGSSEGETRRRTASCAVSSSFTTISPRSCVTAFTRGRTRTVHGSVFPGPVLTSHPDIDDVGFMSISIKLMGVLGPKLMDEEKFTQDMFSVSTPTFVTPDTKANAQLQIESLKNAQIYYFVNFHRPHLLDLVMQSLWLKTQSSPFESPYFSCVPYLLGEGQAMQYSVWPKSTRRTPIPRLPLRLPTTICAMQWSPHSRKEMSNSIFACKGKRIRT